MASNATESAPYLPGYNGGPKPAEYVEPPPPPQPTYLQAQEEEGRESPASEEESPLAMTT